jgi:hypothetical protein
VVIVAQPPGEASLAKVRRGHGDDAIAAARADYDARRAARGREARAKLRAAAGLEELAERCERIAEQIAKRAGGRSCGRLPERTGRQWTSPPGTRFRNTWRPAKRRSPSHTHRC